MKFALVACQKQVSTKGNKGFCPCCGEGVRAYCGQIRIHHWKHKRLEICDPWYEGETE